MKRFRVTVEGLILADRWDARNRSGERLRE
jgi:hypothetical protein